MGYDHDDGAAGHLLADHRDESSHGTRIETGGRLVEKEESRGVDEGARESNLLALPARVRTHRTGGERAELEAVRGERQRVLDVQAMQSGRELDVFPPGEIAVAERIVSYPAQASPDLFSRATESPVIHLPGSRLGEPPHEREKRRLAGAVRSQDEGRLARVEACRHPHEGAHGTERLRHRVKLNAECSSSFQCRPLLSFGIVVGTVDLHGCVLPRTSSGSPREDRAEPRSLCMKHPEERDNTLAALPRRRQHEGERRCNCAQRPSEE
jgi:hypothetical protein